MAGACRTLIKSLVKPSILRPAQQGLCGPITTKLVRFHTEHNKEDEPPRVLITGKF